MGLVHRVAITGYRCIMKEKEQDGLGHYLDKSHLDNAWAYVAVALFLVTAVCAYLSGALELALGYFRAQ